LDNLEPGLIGVAKPALDDVRNPIGSCLGQDNRVESYPVAPFGDDRRSLRATLVIEPEELTEIVG